ncbi:hypothetical protein ACFX2H_013203 [Malus domestica]
MKHFPLLSKSERCLRADADGSDGSGLSSLRRGRLELTKHGLLGIAWLFQLRCMVWPWRREAETMRKMEVSRKKKQTKNPWT